MFLDDLVSLYEFQEASQRKVCLKYCQGSYLVPRMRSVTPLCFTFQ